MSNKLIKTVILGVSGWQGWTSRQPQVLSLIPNPPRDLFFHYSRPWRRRSEEEIHMLTSESISTEALSEQW